MASLHELGLQAQARRYESSNGKLEEKLVERLQARKARTTRKTLRALCKQYNGNREYHVRVRLCTGTIFTEVTPTQDPDVFTGRRYPAKVLQGESCGTQGTFRLSNVAEHYVTCKGSTVTRR